MNRIKLSNIPISEGHVIPLAAGIGQDECIFKHMLASASYLTPPCLFANSIFEKAILGQREVLTPPDGVYSRVQRLLDGKELSGRQFAMDNL